MAQKRKYIRASNGFIKNNSFTSINIAAYKFAIKSDSLELTEYWYQSVFHGGNINSRRSKFHSNRKYSIADEITGEIFRKTQNMLSNDIFNEIEKITDILFINNPILSSTSSLDEVLDFIFFIIEINNLLISNEIIIFAYFIRISGLYTLLLLLEFDNIIIYNIIILIKEQEETNLSPKKALISKFDSWYQCEKYLNTFVIKFKTYLSNMALSTTSVLKQAKLA